MTDGSGAEHGAHTSHDQIREQCSMTHWWPRLQDAGVPVPDTIRVGAEPRPILDGSMSLPLPDKGDLADATEKVGGPPAFLRSDQMSAKHNMAASRIDSTDPDDLGWNTGGMAEQHSQAWGAPDPKCYYVREWLDLWHRYKTFADSETPIAAEIRVFLHDGDVHDLGFYWPMGATWEHSATEENWQELHQETQARADEGADRVADLARQVAVEFDTGYWSVDFALTEGEEWYCIDMARGELSWHPDSVERPVGVGSSE